MANEKFKECLLDVYHAEINGEAALEVMLGAAADPEEAYVLGSLVQLETEAKAMIRPLLGRYGLPITPGPAPEGGAEAIEQVNAMAWTERFTLLREVTQTQFLPRYEELGTLITKDEDPDAAKLARFMADHEHAVIALADNVIAGIPDPAAPVAKLLHFPLTKPA